MSGRGRFQSAKALYANKRRYLLWASQSMQAGAGKTHFGLTAPGPIAVMLFDPDGIGPLLEKPEFRDKDIDVIEYKFNPGQLDIEERPEAAKAAYDAFVEDYATALGYARTVIWDKEDHVWEMLRYAKLEAVSDKPASYYELNLEYRGWFADAAEAGVNLGVIRGMKEKWGKVGVNGQGKPVLGATGVFEARGQKEVSELVQVVLDHRFDPESGEFKLVIGGSENKCRVGPAAELIGQDLASPSFDDLVALLYPEVEPEAWAA